MLLCSTNYLITLPDVTVKVKSNTPFKKIFEAAEVRTMCQIESRTSVYRKRRKDLVKNQVRRVAKALAVLCHVLTAVVLGRVLGCCRHF